MSFPILKINDNCLCNKKGEISYVFKFLPLDFEQLNYDTLVSYFESVKSFIQSTSSNDYIRLYKINGEIYLVTSIKDINFPSVVLVPEEDPIGFYVGHHDFFSDVKIEDDYLVYNGKFHKFINVREFPNEISENHLGDIGLDFVVSFQKMSELKQKSFVDHKDGTYKGKDKQSKSKIEQSKATTALTVIEDIAKELSNGEEALFHIETWIIVSDVSKGVIFPCFHGV